MAVIARVHCHSYVVKSKACILLFDFVIVNIINLILSCTVFQLSHSICQINPSDKRAVVNALVPRNFCEYRHRIYGPVDFLS